MAILYYDKDADLSLLNGNTARNHQVEKVGEQLRAMMPFIKPKRLQDYDPS